jgi:ATP-dependent protease HslVU (ClpYQ) peptidase subunit
VTTIVGIQGDGWSVLASDSMINSGSQPFFAKGMEKLFERSDYLLGIAGDAVAIDILKCLWKPPRSAKPTDLDYYLTTKVIPSLRASCSLNGYDLQKDKKDDPDAGFELLLSLKGRIWQISSDDFGWLRDRRGLYAIGSGGQIALGVLAALDTRSVTSALKAARKAIEVACNYDINTGGEVQVLTQKE